MSSRGLATKEEVQTAMVSPDLLQSPFVQLRSKNEPGSYSEEPSFLRINCTIVTVCSQEPLKTLSAFIFSVIHAIGLKHIAKMVITRSPNEISRRRSQIENRMDRNTMEATSTKQHTPPTRDKRNEKLPTHPPNEEFKNRKPIQAMESETAQMRSFRRFIGTLFTPPPPPSPSSPPSPPYPSKHSAPPPSTSRGC